MSFQKCIKVNYAMKIWILKFLAVFFHNSKSYLKDENQVTFKQMFKLYVFVSQQLFQSVNVSQLKLVRL